RRIRQHCALGTSHLEIMERVKKRSSIKFVGLLIWDLIFAAPAFMLSLRFIALPSSPQSKRGARGRISATVTATPPRCLAN
ncbi:hypothetical protein, partial [Actinopolyspora saharensis]|uniref:hypothetical protein n=1 Tax=Actinopolyspora saharensis TaxID=995062 RepID=UPI003F66F75A